MRLDADGEAEDDATGDVSRRAKTRFDEAHQAVEHIPDEADRQNAEDDPLVNQVVVLLPQEPPDPRRAGQHFGPRRSPARRSPD